MYLKTIWLSVSEDHLVKCIQAGKVTENAAPAIASETEKMAAISTYSDEDPFLDCDELEEDEAVIDHD